MPTCTQASLVADSACYKNFSDTERASILIYFNVLELAQIGGATDYTLQMGSGGTLSTDSKCLMELPDNFYCPPNPYQLVIAYNNAVTLGAVPATTQAGLATAIACNKNFSSADKAAQMLWLLCQLGEHCT